MLVDLSLSPLKTRLYERFSSFHSGPFGLLPHYLCAEGARLNLKKLHDELVRSAEAGVGYWTLHLTADADLFNLARNLRRLPTTSRGGGIVLRDAESRQSKTNSLLKILPSIVDLARKHSIAISLGSTFRPASTFQALDEVHRAETLRQLSLAKTLYESGIQVCVEGIGHAKLKTLSDYFSLVEASQFCPPVIALGPTPNDSAGRQDPIASAVALGALSPESSLGAFQAITSIEHSGGVPSPRVTKDALRIARAICDSINTDRGYAARSDRVGLHREYANSCVTPSGKGGSSYRKLVSVGCSRCEEHCPLLIDDLTRKETVFSHLEKTLPNEIRKKFGSMMRILSEGMGGTVILFGSTAKGEFSFSKSPSGFTVFLSDIELNLVKSSWSRKESEEVENLVDRIFGSEIDAQPFFDVDIRLKTPSDFKEIEYSHANRREIFCYGVIAGEDVAECFSRETDLLAKMHLPSHFQSLCEWLLLRLVHINRYKGEDRDWLLSALKVLLVRKSLAYFCVEYGIPFTATSLDIEMLGRAGLKKRTLETLSTAYLARADKSGELISSESICWDQVEEVWAEVESIVFAYQPMERIQFHDLIPHPLSAVEVAGSEWVQFVEQRYAHHLKVFRGGSALFKIRYEKHLGVQG